MSYNVPVTTVFEWQQSVKDKDLTAPPGGESKGDRYLILGTGSGAWAGQTGNIATYNGATWDFTAKKEGMVCYVKDEALFYLYIAAWAVYSIAQADVTGLHTTDSPTFAGLNLNGALARGANAITGAGDLGAIGTYITNAYITNLYLNATAKFGGGTPGVADLVGKLTVDHIGEHTASHGTNFDDEVGIGADATVAQALKVAGGTNRNGAFVSMNFTEDGSMNAALGGYTGTSGVKTTTQTSGTLYTSVTYKIITYNTNDDFTNVGASSNANGVVFVATGTTPAHWAHSSVLQVGRLLYGLQYGNWFGINGATAVGDVCLEHIGLEAAGLITFWPGAGGFTAASVTGVRGWAFHNTMGGGAVGYVSAITNAYGGYFGVMWGNAEPTGTGVTATNVYGVYISAPLSNAQHKFTNEYELYVEAPVNAASTNKYQSVLAGTGAGTGLWFSSGATTTPRIWASSATQGRLGYGTTNVVAWESSSGPKLGFFAATPVVRQAHIADATSAATVITQLNALLLAMETYGLLATS